MGYRELENIIKAHTRNWKTDFYDYDVIELNEPEERYYLWIVRTHGTHLIPKSNVPTSEVLSYWLQHENDTGNKLNYYEVDTDTMTPTRISNIEQYVERCRNEAEMQNVYAPIDNDDFDYDY